MVSEQLKHSSITVRIDTYSHATLAFQKEAAEQFAGLEDAALQIVMVSMWLFLSGVAFEKGHLVHCRTLHCVEASHSAGAGTPGARQD